MKRAIEQEMEAYGKLKQGDLKEQEEYKRLMEEDMHL